MPSVCHGEKQVHQMFSVFSLNTAYYQFPLPGPRVRATDGQEATTVHRKGIFGDSNSSYVLDGDSVYKDMSLHI